MSKPKQIEREYYGATFVGVVKQVDDSFDHEFGTEQVTSLELEEFKVFTYINDIDYDITSSISEKTLEGWKDWFLEEVSSEF